MTVRHAAAGAVASVVLLTSIAVAAGDDRQSSPAAGTAATGESPSLFAQGAAKNPYGKLFTGATVAAQQRPFERETEAARPEKPKVVCGTVLVPADASVDPHMRKSPPANDTTKHTMRVVKPPMCTSE